MSKLTLKEGIDFVKPLSEEFSCPICLGLLEDPYLTACCGNHFCESCANKVKKNNNKCPLCQDTPLNGIINKGLKRKVNELKVYCSHKETGCNWTGDLGRLELHLATNKTEGECQFITVKCPVSTNCGAKLFRKSLEDHVTNICDYRQVKCKYCDYQSTYVAITTSHNNVCLKYPVPCPNNCSPQMHPRSLLDSHLSLCPEQEVACAFSEMGCIEKMKRRSLQEHMKANILKHQMDMCQAYKAQNETIKTLLRDKKQLEEKVTCLTQKVSNVPSSNWRQEFKSTIEKERKCDWSLYLSKMTAISFIYSVAPLLLEVPLAVKLNINSCKCGRTGSWFTAQPYCSFPFYSQQNGYKLQLSVKLVNQCPNCVIRYLNLYSIPPFFTKQGNGMLVDIQIMDGEHDHELKWPFKKQISVTLLNKVTDNYHYGIKINCEGNRKEKLRPQRDLLQQQQFDELFKALSTADQHLQQGIEKTQLDIHQKFYEATEPNSLFFPCDDNDFPGCKGKSSLAAKRLARAGYETTVKVYFEVAVCYLNSN